MIITCTQCDTSFNLDDQLVSATGTKVRCSQCQNIFVAYPEAPASDLSDIDTAAAEQEPETETEPETEPHTEPEAESEVEPAPEPEVEDLQLEEEPESSDPAPADELFMEIPEIESDLQGEDWETEPAAPEAEAEQLEGFDFEDIDKMLITDGEITGLDDSAEDKQNLDIGTEDLALDIEPVKEAGDSISEDAAPEDVIPEIEFDFEEPLENETVTDASEPEVEDEAASDAPAEDALEIETLDLDLEPFVETDGETDRPAIDAEETLEIDFEEIEQMAETDQPAIDAEETLEIDFEEIEQMAEMDEMPSAPTEEETATDDETFELDLESILETGEEESPQTSDPEPLAGIDFGELEETVDAATKAADETKPEEVAEEEELELDFELGLDDEQDAGAAQPQGEGDSEFELVLPELDEIIEEDDTQPVAEEIPDDLELDLDAELELEAEDDLEEAPEGTAPTDDMQQIDAFDDVLVEETAPATETLPDEDDLAYELEEDEQEVFEPEEADHLSDAETADLFAAETTDMPDTKTEEGAFTDDEAMSVAEPKKVATSFDKPPKKRISTPVIVLLVIVLIGGGGYAAYTVLNMLNIKVPFLSNIGGLNIPFVSDFFKTSAKDPGNQRISTVDLNSKFVENSKAGRLFVVTGKVKNEYPKSRSFIKVTGKLYTKAKTPVKVETISCGNVLSDLELASLDIAEIKKRLGNRFGEKRSNLKVKTGQTLSFMIVFSGFPDNIEEFTIEIAGSTPV